MKRIQELKNMFKQNMDYYKKDSFWLVMYSGGKDSTVMVDLVLKTVKKENLDIPVYIMITRVKSEYPMYEKYLDRALLNIKKYIKEQELENVKIIENNIDYSKRFLFTILGKGYPVPRNNMRWCTLQMKIKTAEKIEREIKKRHQGLKPVKIIGTRKEEGITRAKRIEKNNNQIINGFYSVMPIQDFTLQDVWNYAKNELSINKKELFELYGNITMDENNSIRQGCWFCPLVKEDEFLEKKYPKLEYFRKVLKEHMIKEGIRYSVDRRFNKENISGFLKTSVRKNLFNILINSLKEYKSEIEFFLPLNEMFLIQKYMFLDGGDFLFTLTDKYLDITNNIVLKSEIERITETKNIYEIFKKISNSIFNISIEEAAESIAKKIIFALKKDEKETLIKEKEDRYILYITDQDLEITVLKNINDNNFTEQQKKAIKKITNKKNNSSLKTKLNEFTILIIKNYFKHLNKKICYNIT